MHIDIEHSLIHKAKAGEQEALGLLWDEITPRLYGYLLTMLKNKPQAEDVLQDTWLKAISALPSYQHKKVRFSAWLFAIARNECRMRWRKQHREVALDDQPDISETNSLHSATEDKLDLENILIQLKDKDRDILYLRYISELTFNDIAQVLAISPVSARVRVHRALGRAQKLLVQNV